MKLMLSLCSEVGVDVVFVKLIPNDDIIKLITIVNVLSNPSNTKFMSLKLTLSHLSQENIIKCVQSVPESSV